MSVFAMPSLGADMEAGKLVEWLVKPGDTVKRGDVVAVVETQKGAIEIEIFEDGTVESLTAGLGDELPVFLCLGFRVFRFRFSLIKFMVFRVLRFLD